ncbi:MAG: DHH family phosphoesterase [Ignavibacteria bacterium]
MFENILKLINNKQNFVITSHVNPDGDSIGSEIALHKYLKNLGKTARIINYSLTPQNYTFLDNSKIIEKFDENTHNAVLQNAEVIFILDTNEYSRLKTMANSVMNSPAKKVCIDHHMGFNLNGFDFFISDTDSPATGEVLYKLFTYNGNNSISADIAVALYAAIMTDTGSFRFPRTDSETHKIAAKLIEYGADPVEIYNEIYDKSSFGKLKLLSIFLNKLILACDNKLIYASLLQKDFIDTGTTEIDTEGFSSHMMSIKTVQIGIIFTETKRGIKISFRSKGDAHVNELAKEFGGGGHSNAAGSFIENANLEELIKNVLAKAKNYIK